MQLFGLGWKDEWEGAAWGAGPESCPHAAAPASGPAAWAERQRLHRVEDAETLTWINASPWEVVGFPPLAVLMKKRGALWGLPRGVWVGWVRPMGIAVLSRTALLRVEVPYFSKMALKEF